MARFGATIEQLDQEAAELAAYLDAMEEHRIASVDASLKTFKLAASGEYYEVMFHVPLNFGEELLNLVANQQRILSLLVARKKRGTSFFGV